MKHAVLLLKKRGLDPTDPSFYRPLTLLSVMGNVLERAVSVRTEDAVGGKIADTRYGFWRGQSAEDWVVRACNNMQRMRQHSTFVAAVLLDIRGTFNHLYIGTIL